MVKELNEKELDNVAGGVDACVVPNTYVVKAGDMLSTIAPKFGLTWKKLYQLNKELIDKDAKAHGVKANFENYIYPGQVLKVK